MNKIKSAAFLLAVIFTAGSAFIAPKPAHRAFDGKYQFSGTDGTYYILGANVTNENPGPTTYQCNANAMVNCTVETTSLDVVTRNGHTEIPSADAGDILTGNFQLN